MNPSQTQALLQDAKNEVAINHSARSYIDWKNKTGLDSFPDQLADEVAELYHTRLLAEAGKELPSDATTHAELEGLRHTNFSRGYQRGYLDGNNAMKQSAQTLLAAKQAEMFGFIEWMRQQCWEPYQEGWSQDRGVTQIEASELFKQYKPQ